MPGIPWLIMPLPELRKKLFLEAGSEEVKGAAAMYHFDLTPEKLGQILDALP